MSAKGSTKGLLSLGRNAAFLAVSHGGAGLTRALYALLLASLLGPATYGIYAYGQSWYLAFLPLTLHAADSSLAIVIATRAGRWREEVAERLVLRGGASVAAALLCGLLGVVFVPDPEQRYLLPPFAAALLGRGMSLWVNAVFVARERSGVVMVQELLFRLLEVAIGTLWLLSGGGILGIVLVHAATWWAQALRGLYLVRRNLGPLTWRLPRLDAAMGNQMLLVAAGFAGAWMIQGPLILYGWFSGASSELGQFALVMQFFFFAIGVPWAFAQAVLPPLSRAVASGSGRDRQFAEAIPRLAILAGSLAAIIGFSLGPPLFDWLLGERYATAGRLLGPMMLVMMPATIGHGLSQLLISSHRLRLHLLTALFGALGLSISLPPLLVLSGAMGVVVATGLGYSLWCGSQLWLLSRQRPLDWVRTLLRPALAAVAALGLYGLIMRLEMPVVAALAGTAMLVAASLLTGAVSAEERRVIAYLIPRLLRRRETGS